MAILAWMIVLALALAPTVAEASPFLIRVGTSGSGSSGSGDGSGGGASGAGKFGFPVRGAPGGTGAVGSVVIASPGRIDAQPATDLAHRPASVSEVSSGSGYGVAIDGGLALGSTHHPPNTSPFGSTGLMISPIRPGGLGSAVPSVAPVMASGATPGTMALLNLGSGDYLAVSGAVADSLEDSVSLGSLGPSHSATASVSGDVTEASKAVLSGTVPGLVAAIIPNPGLGLITYPTDLTFAAPDGSSVFDRTPVPNPEPATLLLLGGGLALTQRYVLKRKRNAGPSCPSSARSKL